LIADHSQSTGPDKEKWKTRVDGLLDKFFERFFPTTIVDKPGSPNVMVEVSCEPAKKCNPDQTSFKAYTSRWLAVTAQLCPWAAAKIKPKLQGSAQGAAKQCSGGDSGSWCGQNWNADVWDGFQGVGEQMSALATIGANLISQKPLTAKTGGTSEGDPNAGSILPHFTPYKISTPDKAGAGVVTFLAVFTMLMAAWWMVDGD
jgi:Glycosyl hydrolase family 76